jgi:hypothetical protein
MSFGGSTSTDSDSYTVEVYFDSDAVTGLPTECEGGPYLTRVQVWLDGEEIWDDSDETSAQNPHSIEIEREESDYHVRYLRVRLEGNYLIDTGDGNERVYIYNEETMSFSFNTSRDFLNSTAHWSRNRYCCYYRRSMETKVGLVTNFRVSTWKVPKARVIPQPSSTSNVTSSGHHGFSYRRKNSVVQDNSKKKRDGEKTTFPWDTE